MGLYVFVEEGGQYYRELMEVVRSLGIVQRLCISPMPVCRQDLPRDLIWVLNRKQGLRNLTSIQLKPLSH